MERQLLKEFQPVVIPMQFYLQGPLVAGMVAFFPGTFAFVISNMIAQTRGAPIVGFGVGAYVIGFLGILGLAWVKYMIEPEYTRYSIYPDSLEYSEGFFNRVQRSISLQDVVDVRLTESVLQQPFQAGTITLITSQLVGNGEGKLHQNTIVMANVPKPREIYELLRSLRPKAHPGNDVPSA